MQNVEEHGIFFGGQFSSTENMLNLPESPSAQFDNDMPVAPEHSYLQPEKKQGPQTFNAVPAHSHYGMDMDSFNENFEAEQRLMQSILSYAGEFQQQQQQQQEEEEEEQEQEEEEQEQEHVEEEQEEEEQVEEQEEEQEPEFVVDANLDTFSDTEFEFDEDGFMLDDEPPQPQPQKKETRGRKRKPETEEQRMNKRRHTYSERHQHEYIKRNQNADYRTPQVSVGAALEVSRTMKEHDLPSLRATLQKLGVLAQYVPEAAEQLYDVLVGSEHQLFKDCPKARNYLVERALSKKGVTTVWDSLTVPVEDLEMHNIAVRIRFLQHRGNNASTLYCSPAMAVELLVECMERPDVVAEFANNSHDSTFSMYLIFARVLLDVGMDMSAVAALCHFDENHALLNSEALLPLLSCSAIDLYPCKYNVRVKAKLESILRGDIPPVTRGAFDRCLYPLAIMFLYPDYPIAKLGELLSNSFLTQIKQVVDPELDKKSNEVANLINHGTCDSPDVVRAVARANAVLELTQLARVSKTDVPAGVDARTTKNVVGPTDRVMYKTRRFIVQVKSQEELDGLAQELCTNWVEELHFKFVGSDLTAGLFSEIGTQDATQWQVFLYTGAASDMLAMSREMRDHVLQAYNPDSRRSSKPEDVKNFMRVSQMGRFFLLAVRSNLAPLLRTILEWRSHSEFASNYNPKKHITNTGLYFAAQGRSAMNMMLKKLLDDEEPRRGSFAADTYNICASTLAYSMMGFCNTLFDRPVFTPTRWKPYEDMPTRTGKMLLNLASMLPYVIMEPALDRLQSELGLDNLEDAPTMYIRRLSLEVVSQRFQDLKAVKSNPRQSSATGFFNQLLKMLLTCCGTIRLVKTTTKNNVSSAEFSLYVPDDLMQQVLSHVRNFNLPRAPHAELFHFCETRTGRTPDADNKHRLKDGEAKLFAELMYGCYMRFLPLALRIKVIKRCMMHSLKDLDFVGTQTTSQHCDSLRMMFDKEPTEDMNLHLCGDQEDKAGGALLRRVHSDKDYQLTVDDFFLSLLLTLERCRCDTCAGRNSKACNAGLVAYRGGHVNPGRIPCIAKVEDNVVKGKIGFDEVFMFRSGRENPSHLFRSTPLAAGLEKRHFFEYLEEFRSVAVVNQMKK